MITEREILKSITNKISENNEIIKHASKENERLFKSLLRRLDMPQEKIDRINKELAYDNWKKYSKTFPLFDMDSDQADA